MKQLPLKTACETINVPYRSVLYYHKKKLIPVDRVANRNMIEPRVLRSVLDKLRYRQREQAMQVH